MEGRYSDSLGRYYTRPTLGSVLVRAMDVVAPRTVVDLGAGGGTLIGEAAKVWRRANFITIDIDPVASTFRIPVAHGSTYKHVVADALDAHLSDHLGISWGAACAAVCNPPYIRPQWRSHFRRILADVGLDHILPHAEDIPADVLFVAQNLRLLKRGGQLGVILPDGLVAGERFSQFRRTLILNHAVRQVIELPRRIFRHTEAKAHIVVLTKDQTPSTAIEVRRLERNGELSSPKLVPPDRAVARLDYSYHSTARSARKRKPCILVDMLIAAIIRGSHSSRARASLPFPVLHTSDVSESDTVAPSKFKLPKQYWNRNCGVVASPGDLLVARVGRNFSSKVCKVVHGPTVVSDCFLVLRPRPDEYERVFSFLRSNRGRCALESASHGVGAKFITQTAINQILL